MDNSSYTPQPSSPPAAGKSRIWIWVLASLLIILCTIFFYVGLPVSGFVLLARQQEHVQATSTAQSLATQTSEAVLAQPPSSWQKVVGDVFIKNDGDWNLNPDRDTGADVARSIENGRFIFRVSRMMYSNYYFAEPGSVQNNPISQLFLAVNARQIGGSTGDNNYGLVFRHLDDDDYSIFEVQENGYAGVETLDHNDWSTNIAWTREPSLTLGQFSRLVVLTDSNGYEFLVNNHLVGRVDNLPIVKGNAGMFIYGRTSSGVTYEFDDFQAYVPPQQ